MVLEPKKTSEDFFSKGVFGKISDSEMSSDSEESPRFQVLFEKIHVARRE